MSPLSDLLAHFDSEEYLDTLHQLADSLLQEIDASTTGKTENVPVGNTRECSKGSKVVGTTAEQLESDEGVVVDMKHDVDRILSQHSYAHPYTSLIEDTAQIKEENNDKGDIFYASCDEANDCITIEVPCEEHVADDVKPVEIDMDFNTLTDNGTGLTLDCDMRMLSPLGLSPKPVEDNLLLSPSHTSLSSDLGYESLSSPLSESDSMDLSDFWCESFSELFPGLA